MERNIDDLLEGERRERDMKIKYGGTVEGRERRSKSLEKRIKRVWQATPSVRQLTWASLYLSHREEQLMKGKQGGYSGCVSLGKGWGLEPIPTMGAMKVVRWFYFNTFATRQRISDGIGSRRKVDRWFEARR